MLTPWKELEEEVFLKNVTSPLFAVLTAPQANNIDLSSPLGMPIFYDAIEELKDFDIAYSRNAKEIFDSKRIVLLDSDRLLPTGGKIAQTGLFFERQRESLGLPDYIKNVYGNGQDDFYKEINPTLNTEVRLKGLNALLSQIGFKVGFSNGYFVFDEKGGIKTATEIEANDQRTIQFIKDVRDKIEECLKDLIYSLSAFADLYDLAPLGEYDVVFDFGDITYNKEEDRQRWWGYVIAGKVPAYKFFMKFEGMTEEEARAMVDEAQPRYSTLFER